MTPNDIFSLLYRQFRSEIIFIVFLYAMEMGCRLGFSVMLQELFYKVSYISEGDNKRDAYIRCVLRIYIPNGSNKQTQWFLLSSHTSRPGEKLAYLTILRETI